MLAKKEITGPRTVRLREEDVVKPEDGTRKVFYDYISQPHFKRFLHNLACIQEERGFKSLAVLSAKRGEGKTFLVSVLALAYAQFLKKRVLILDTISQTRDESFYYRGNVLGAPTEHNVDPKRLPPGVIDLITTRNLSRQVQVYKRHGLRLPYTGDRSGDYGEEANGEATDFHIGRFVETHTAEYDLILLDTCSLEVSNGGTIDPLVLARQANAAILVTSPLSLDRTMVEPLKRELKKCRVNLLGTVYNQGAIHA